MEKQKPIIELDLYLIRHGQSQGNAGYGRDNLTLKESNDPVLTELGISQAQAAGRHLAEIDFDAFYSSGLLRAARTASEIMKAQNGEKKLNVLPQLTEVGVSSEYSGVGIEEIREFCPSAQLADGVDPMHPLVCCNSHDDEAGLFERAEKVIEYLREKYKNGEKVVAVSHAAFITFIVFLIMGFKNNMPKFDISFYNTGITRIIFYKEGTNPYGDIVFEYINDTTHLK
ncbi:MAG: histidine phosphatase family protein [Clostridia bacterium]|nr:histidine phosphatase family protein [Clostridia bacterium]